MSAARKLRRAQQPGKQNPVDALAELTKTLEQAAKKADVYKDLPGLCAKLRSEVELTQEIVGVVIDDYNTLAFEMEMQRMVSLRLSMWTMVMAATGHTRAEDCLILEAQYRAEWVALKFIETLG